MNRYKNRYFLTIYFILKAIYTTMLYFIVFYAHGKYKTTKKKV